ncbi:MAG: ZIP family metal transporter [Flavobacteriales bacterium]|jgi:zinc transporter ZupT|nr:ZIP family metal transporter [Flavobacteriales bacterium]MCB0758789.1 ZIP family metal transporter [Flavobacteriales bacterium]
MSLPLLIILFMALPLAAGAWVRFRTTDPGHVKLLLAFSGAFLLSVTVLHMLPELYSRNDEHVGLWILAGFMLQVVLEFFSRGIEHGHVHVSTHSSTSRTLPLATLLSLVVHSFTEGMPFADPRVGGDLPFVVGVLLHKLPMAIALATVLQRSSVGAGRSWATLAIFAVSAPLGILFGHHFGMRMGEQFLSGALALAIGMLLHISTTIIFETTPDHRFNAKRFATVLLGALLAILTSH